GGWGAHLEQALAVTRLQPAEPAHHRLAGRGDRMRSPNVGGRLAAERPCALAVLVDLAHVSRRLIDVGLGPLRVRRIRVGAGADTLQLAVDQDRKSTRLNSSHRTNSYAVFS